MFENVRACLFDFDGTLIRPSIDFDSMRRVILDLARRHGATAQPFATMPVLEIIGYVTEELSDRDPRQGQEFHGEAHRVVIAIELEAAEGVRAYPGVAEALGQLGAWGFGVAIITRNCRTAVERVLARIAIHHDVLLTRDDVDRVKPDPGHLLAALSVLGVPGHEALMCGDHPMDVVAGRRIDASTVAVLAPGSPRDRVDGLEPDLVVSSVTEILDHVDPLR